MFENIVPRRILGPKTDEITGGWRKLHYCLMFYKVFFQTVGYNWVSTKFCHCPMTTTVLGLHVSLHCFLGYSENTGCVKPPPLLFYFTAAATASIIVFRISHFLSDIRNNKISPKLASSQEVAQNVPKAENLIFAGHSLPILVNLKMITFISVNQKLYGVRQENLTAATNLGAVRFPCRTTYI
jgi:hypothetical protein